MLNWLDDLIRAPASCIVRIAGGEISNLYPQLVEVSALLSCSEASEVTLVFETRRQSEDRWSIHDDIRIRPWQPIYLAASFGSREEEIFQGFIRQVKVEFPEQKGAAKVTVTCQDNSLLLDRTQREQGVAHGVGGHLQIKFLQLGPDGSDLSDQGGHGYCVVGSGDSPV